MNPLVWLGASLVGLSLGLTGAGGSIVTLPLLVYLGGVPPEEAVALSLLVVGAAAMAGAAQRWRVGEFHARAALLFAFSGMAGAWQGARFTRLIPPELLMALFAVLMVAVAVRMMRSRDEETTASPECRPWRCLAAGVGTGALTGFLGVGGGFLLMPALIKFARLPIRMAAGTSLAVIAFNSAAGFLAHLKDGPVDWRLAGIFSGLAVAGTLAGSALASKLPIKRLRQGFAVVALLSGLGMLARIIA